MIICEKMVNRCFFFHFKDFHNLIINNWKKQIVLCPNINDNYKEWGKEFVEKMVKKELEKQESGFKRW